MLKPFPIFPLGELVHDLIEDLAQEKRIVIGLDLVEVSRLSYDPKCISFSVLYYPHLESRALEALISIYRAFPPCLLLSTFISTSANVRLAFTKATKCELEFEAKIMATSLDLDLLQRLTHRPPQSLGNFLKFVVKTGNSDKFWLKNFRITKDQKFVKVIWFVFKSLKLVFKTVVFFKKDRKFNKF